MPAHNKRYPWDEWLVPGRTVTLRQGDDYECERYSLAQQARNAARVLGVLVSCKAKGLPPGTLQLTTRVKPRRTTRAPAAKPPYRRPPAKDLRGG